MATTPTSTTTLSGLESKVYDRQIRLWGLEAQKRMHNACILVVGFDGLAVEVVKNLVLSGIGALHLMEMEEKAVSEEDLCVNFFLTEADVGSSDRLRCACSRVQELNPLVSVKMIQADENIHSDAFWLSYDAVVFTQGPCALQEYVSLLLHSHGKGFLSGKVHGLLGGFFSDFGGEFSYFSERKNPEDETKIVRSEGSVQFSSFTDALGTPLSAIPKCSRSLAAWRALWEFQSFEEKNSGIDDRYHHSCQFLQEQGLSSSFLDGFIEPIIDSGLGVSFCPICAVLGGFMTQEILKFVSHKDAPVNNFLLYDAIESFSAIVERVPSSELRCHSEKISSLSID